MFREAKNPIVHCISGHVVLKAVLNCPLPGDNSMSYKVENLTGVDFSISHNMNHCCGMGRYIVQSQFIFKGLICGILSNVLHQ